MPYVPTVWEDEVPEETPVRFRIRDAEGNVVHEGATIELITPVIPGTPLHAANLNKIEQGIVSVENSLNSRLTNDVAALQTQLDTLTSALGQFFFFSSVASFTEQYVDHVINYPVYFQSGPKLFITPSTGISAVQQVTVSIRNISPFSATVRIMTDDTTGAHKAVILDILAWGTPR